MAAPPPHEALQIERMTLERFCDTAFELSKRVEGLVEDLPRSYQVANFILTGRYRKDDGTESRVFVEEPHADNADDAANDESVASRYLGTMVAVLRSLDLDTDLAVHPVPLNLVRMENPLGIKLEVIREDDSICWVRVDEVPHVLVAGSENKDLKIWLCCPRLYFPGCSTKIWEKWLATVYECMVYALRPHSGGFRRPESRAVWKDTLQATELGTNAQWNKANMNAVCVKKINVLPWSTTFLNRLTAAHRMFKDAVYFVSYTPRKNAADSTDAGNFTRAYNEDTSIIRMRNGDELEQWTVQLNLEFSRPGYTVLWKPNAWMQFLTCSVPLIEKAVLEERLCNSKASWKNGPTAWSPSYGKISLGGLQNNKDYKKIEFKFQDSEDVPRGGAWRTYTPSDTLPEQLGKTVQQIRDLIKIIRVRARNNELGGGYSTASVTMPLHKARGYFVINDREDLFSIVPTLTWWTCKYWRAKAVCTVLERLMLIPVQIRGRREGALAMGVIATHILNTITIPETISPDLDHILSCAILRYIPGAETDEELEMGWAAEEDIPALQDRGLYFIAGMNCIRLNNDAFYYEVAGIDGTLEDSKIEMKILARVHRLGSTTALQALFGITGHKVKGASKEEVNRLSRPRNTTGQVWFNSSWRPMIAMNDVRLERIRIDAPLRIIDDPTPQHVIEAGFDDDVEEVLSKATLPEILSEILYQLAHDIIARIPNRGARGPTFTTLGAEERDRVPWVMLQQATLPFNAVVVAEVDKRKFDDVVARFLPSKGYRPTGKAHGFDASTYLRIWCELLNRLSGQNAAVVTEIMREKLHKLTWLPKATNTAMWNKNQGARRGQMILPTGTLEPLPIIMANPRSVYGKNISRFRLRDGEAKIAGDQEWE